MSSSLLLDAIQVEKSLSTKSNFAGSSYNAPKIIDELDELVELGLAVQVMYELQWTQWQPPQVPWTMSKLFSYAEKLRVSDPSEYLRFINELAIIVHKLGMEHEVASISGNKSPPRTKTVKF